MPLNIYSSTAPEPDVSKDTWFRLLLSPAGRINRRQFIGGNLFLFGVFAAWASAMSLLSPESSLSEIGFQLMLPVMLITCWSQLVMRIKRWHDINRSGWMVLLTTIPFVSLIEMIIITLEPGTRETNRFGPQPKSSQGS